MSFTISDVDLDRSHLLTLGNDYAGRKLDCDPDILESWTTTGNHFPDNQYGQRSQESLDVLSCNVSDHRDTSLAPG